tara:strand:- start:18039 stop:18275 length:237 start_codon:yes stop_codon:yes gene_type:complete
MQKDHLTNFQASGLVVNTRLQIGPLPPFIEFFTPFASRPMDQIPGSLVCPARISNLKIVIMVSMQPPKIAALRKNVTN